MWIVRRRLAISASWWQVRDSLLGSGTYSCVAKLLISRLRDNDCSWVAVAVIRATSTATASDDGNNDGDEHYTAYNNACDACVGDVNYAICRTIACRSVAALA